MFRHAHTHTTGALPAEPVMSRFQILRRRPLQILGANQNEHLHQHFRRDSHAKPSDTPMPSTLLDKITLRDIQSKIPPTRVPLTQIKAVYVALPVKHYPLR